MEGAIRGPENSGAEKDSVDQARKLARDYADSREVMNIRQASQYLGVSPDTLYKYVGEQKIPAFKLGNRWRFKKSKLDQWMEEKSVQIEAVSKNKPKRRRRPLDRSRSQTAAGFAGATN